MSPRHHLSVRYSPPPITENFSREFSRNQLGARVKKGGKYVVMGIWKESAASCCTSGRRHGDLYRTRLHAPSSRQSLGRRNLLHLHRLSFPVHKAGQKRYFLRPNNQYPFSPSGYYTRLTNQMWLIIMLVVA